AAGDTRKDASAGPLGAGTHVLLSPPTTTPSEATAKGVSGPRLLAIAGHGQPPASTPVTVCSKTTCLEGSYDHELSTSRDPAPASVPTPSGGGSPRSPHPVTSLVVVSPDASLAIETDHR